MSVLVTILIGFAIGGLYIWLSEKFRYHGYTPRVPSGVNPQPTPPGFPKPPEGQYIMKGLRWPWSPYPLWLWSTYWKLSDLPDTKWARQVKADIAKNSSTRKHRPF